MRGETPVKRHIGGINGLNKVLTAWPVHQRVMQKAVIAEVLAIHWRRADYICYIHAEFPRLKQSLLMAVLFSWLMIIMIATLAVG